MQVTQQSAETNAAARAVQDGKEDILVLWLACRQYAAGAKMVQGL